MYIHMYISMCYWPVFDGFMIIFSIYVKRFEGEWFCDYTYNLNHCVITFVFCNTMFPTGYFLFRKLLHNGMVSFRYNNTNWKVMMKEKTKNISTCKLRDLRAVKVSMYQLWWCHLPSSKSYEDKTCSIVRLM